MALWVVLAHLGLPFGEDFGRHTRLGYLATAIDGTLVCGPAAVIVFFVISGFCIHLGQARDLRLESPGNFLLRRLTRLGIPLLVVLAVWRASPEPLPLFDSVLWSLWCELVYYALYPALLRLRRSGVTWMTMWAGTFSAGLLLSGLVAHGPEYLSYSVGLTSPGTALLAAGMQGRGGDGWGSHATRGHA